MKKEQIERTCPECGRKLKTRTNRFGIEMWPQHKYAAYADRTMDYQANLDRENGCHDNEVACSNSAQPVIE